MNPLTTEPNSRPRHIAFVGDYLPRHCGIATFTYDLCEAVAARYSDTDCFVGALNDRPTAMPTRHESVLSSTKKISIHIGERRIF